ncbi:MAG: BON domain-containing protein [Parachlamydiaceae bacterium]|nr:BON domain-containing protein [Parachlamydiaceae bacterium]
MNKILFVLMVSMTFIACESPDRSNRSMNKVENDNTGKNIRDRDDAAKTSFNQSENESDRTITQKIRQIIVDDDSLSTNAKNIKIITINGVVTLRGPVANAQEKEIIVSKVSRVPGIQNVDNQLEITRNNN